MKDDDMNVSFDMSHMRPPFLFGRAMYALWMPSLALNVFLFSC